MLEENASGPAPGNVLRESFGGRQPWSASSTLPSPSSSTVSMQLSGTARDSGVEDAEAGSEPSSDSTAYIPPSPSVSRLAGRRGDAEDPAPPSCRPVSPVGSGAGSSRGAAYAVHMVEGSTSPMARIAAKERGRVTACSFPVLGPSRAGKPKPGPIP